MIKNKFFYFSGKDEEDNPISGIIDASNKAIAHYTLLKIGLKKIIYLIPVLRLRKNIFNLSIEEKLFIFSHLSLQTNAGISILDSLTSMKLDAASFKLKYLFFIILRNLNEGHRLSLSLSRIKKSPFYKNETSLIRASEISGNLQSTLEFICGDLKNKILIKQKLISSLIYPCITIVISFIAAFIIFKWIIPQFEVIFYKNNHALPWITKLIFFFSKNIGCIFLLTTAAIFLAFIIIALLVKRKTISDKLLEKTLLKIPIFGKLLITKNRINFCYTLSMLLSAGISIHEALRETNRLIDLPYSKCQLNKSLDEIISGKSLSSALKKTQFFPRSAIQTIVVAESSGQLDQAFKIISQQFCNDLSVFSDHAGKIIEPFIIILLGAIIGVVVIAIYLPIFQLGGLY